RLSRPRSCYAHGASQAALALMIDPLARRALGRTSLTVSRIGVGGGSSLMRAPDGGKVIDAAWDAGLRYFDTAPLYGGGRSELAYGRALGHRPREQFVVSTKVGREGEHEFDYTVDGVSRSIARSCERLQMSHVDIASIHDVDPDMH